MGATLQGAAAQAAREIKPLARGWIHTAMVPIVIAAGTVLICLARGGGAKASCAIFIGTAIMLFACSGVYHVGRWGTTVHSVLRRLDHSNIALIIAGTYTPLAVLALSGWQRTVLLVIAWVGALGAIAVRLIWLDAPRWSYVPIYIALGWAAVGFFPALWREAGPTVVWLLLAGGLAYTGGAVVYARRRPDPWPKWFGFHEIFHVGTVIGFVCHFFAVWTVAVP
jgi:hemolysin III